MHSLLERQMRSQLKLQQEQISQTFALVMQGHEQYLKLVEHYARIHTEDLEDE